MPYIKGESREQITMFPESLDDYVADDNPVRVVDAFVNKLDILSMNFDRATAAIEGRPGYDPRDMLKLYIYGYLNKIRSSRKLQTECTRNIELMWLLSKLVPDFRCIADFRKDNAKSIKLVFREFVKVCDRLNLLSKELIAIDGSKFKAVNSKERNFSVGKLGDRIRFIDEKLDKYITELDKNDREDIEPSEHSKEELEQLIQELNERKALYTSYLSELNETGATQKSLTDPESKLMLNNGKMDICFNTQTAVDSKNHIIADFLVTDHCNDTGLLEEVAKGAKEVMEIDTVEMIADKGYRQNEDVLNCLLNGDIPNVYTFDKQTCYTFTFKHNECEITDELLSSADKDDMKKCISTGVLPKILEEKNVSIEVAEVFREKVIRIDEETGEVVKSDEVEINSTSVVQPIYTFFKRNIETDTVICPMGKVLNRKGTTTLKGVRYANSNACKNCRNKCTTSRYRTVDFSGEKDIVKTSFYDIGSQRFPVFKPKPGVIIQRVKIPCGHKILLKFNPDMTKLRLRRTIVEHPFGTVKRWNDGSYLLLKGKVKATADLAFSFLGYNLKRAINIVGVKGILAAI